MIESGVGKSQLPVPARSLSDVQETAQLLCGEAMPEAIISSLLAGSDVGQTIGIVNLTPYDGHLEMHVIKRPRTDPGHAFRTLSLSTDLVVSQHTEKTCAMHLFEDRWAPRPNGKLLCLGFNHLQLFFTW